MDALNIGKTLYDVHGTFSGTPAPPPSGAAAPPPPSSAPSGGPTTEGTAAEATSGLASSLVTGALPGTAITTTNAEMVESTEERIFQGYKSIRPYPPGFKEITPDEVFQFTLEDPGSTFVTTAPGDVLLHIDNTYLWSKLTPIHLAHIDAYLYNRVDTNIIIMLTAAAGTKVAALLVSRPKHTHAPATPESLDTLSSFPHILLAGSATVQALHLCDSPLGIWQQELGTPRPIYETLLVAASELYGSTSTAVGAMTITVEITYKVSLWGRKSMALAAAPTVRRGAGGLVDPQADEEHTEKAESDESSTICLPPPSKPDAPPPSLVQRIIRFFAPTNTEIETQAGVEKDTPAAIAGAPSAPDVPVEFAAPVTERVAIRGAATSAPVAPRQVHRISNMSASLASGQHFADADFPTHHIDAHPLNLPTNVEALGERSTIVAVGNLSVGSNAVLPTLPVNGTLAHWITRSFAYATYSASVITIVLAGSPLESLRVRASIFTDGDSATHRPSYYHIQDVSGAGEYALQLPTAYTFPYYATDLDLSDAPTLTLEVMAHAGPDSTTLTPVPYVAYLGFKGLRVGGLIAGKSRPHTSEVRTAAAASGLMESTTSVQAELAAATRRPPAGPQRTTRLALRAPTWVSDLETQAMAESIAPEVVVRDRTFIPNEVTDLLDTFKRLSWAEPAHHGSLATYYDLSLGADLDFAGFTHQPYGMVLLHGLVDVGSIEWHLHSPPGQACVVAGPSRSYTMQTLFAASTPADVTPFMEVVAQGEALDVKFRTNTAEAWFPAFRQWSTDFMANIMYGPKLLVQFANDTDEHWVRRSIYLSANFTTSGFYLPEDPYRGFSSTTETVEYNKISPT